MKIGGISKTVDYSTKSKAIPVDNDTDFTLLLDRLATAPKIITNMNNFQTSFQTSPQFNQLQYEHRVKTIKNYSLTILQMLGYSALALGTIYIMYRCKVFECIRSCIPSTLCINILCCKQNTEQRIETPKSLYAARRTALRTNIKTSCPDYHPWRNILSFHLEGKSYVSKG